MSVHMQRQLQKVKKLILGLAAEVEQAVHRAIQSVETRDADLARQVIEHDREIDQKEVDVEEECLHTLALEQPVALDLRYIVAVLKMNNDLERIADLAVNVAEQACMMVQRQPIDFTPYLNGMPGQVERMLKDALDCMLEVDIAKAEQVRAADDRIDTLHRRACEQIEAAIRHDPERMPQLLYLMNISRHLERIADLATNIAEDVIYMAKGEIRRHQSISRD